MILDALEYLNCYTKLHAGIVGVLKFLEHHHLQDLPLGRLDIQGDEVFVTINTYVTQGNPKVEFHKVYVDIQMLIEGHEQIGWIPQKDLHCVTSYDNKKDIAFGAGITQKIEAVPGQFLIFFPEDAHQPGIGNGNCVKKAVFKLKL